MGVAITELLEATPTTLSDLAGKTLAVDAYNQLYMFLATIRERDGRLLQDSHGRVTSHLSGLFFRFLRLMEADLRFVFVFDGEVPALKARERQRRATLKQAAAREYDAAVAAQDVDAMRKYAARTSVLTHDMQTEARALISALGQPIVQAPAEGEAQAAALARQGHCFAVMSQDADALLFGAPRVVRNLSVTGRRKLPGKLTTQVVRPELVDLAATLARLRLDQRQLIALALLVGTDYDVGGIKGLGPKKALALVQQYGDDLDALFACAGWSESFDVPWQTPFSLFADAPVQSLAPPAFRAVDEGAVLRLLVDEHDFDRDRVLDALSGLRRPGKPQAQTGLSDFL